MNSRNCLTTRKRKSSIHSLGSNIYDKFFDYQEKRVWGGRKKQWFKSMYTFLICNYLLMTGQREMEGGRSREGKMELGRGYHHHDNQNNFSQMKSTYKRQPNDHFSPTRDGVFPNFEIRNRSTTTTSLWPLPTSSIVRNIWLRVLKFPPKLSSTSLRGLLPPGK